MMRLPADLLRSPIFPRPQRRKRARIEIIPMIDTIFFLLVFFMVVSMSLTRQAGIGVEPPGGGAPLPESRQVLVLIPEEGAVLVNGEPVREDGLSVRLAGLFRVHPDSATVVTADRNVPHGRVVQVMEMARRAGARRFAIGTAREGSGH